jgi:predicted esterase
MKKIVAFCLVLALAVACASTLQADKKKKKTYKKMPSGTFTMKSKGGIEFVLAVPKNYNPKNGAPFMLCIHGDVQFRDMNDFKTMWGNWFNDAAAAGFVACAPKASGQNWVGRTRDLMTLIEELEDKYKFNIRKYIAVGHSSGASPAYQIVLSDTMRFSAFGSMGGRLQIDQEKVKKAGNLGAYICHFSGDPIVGVTHGQNAAKALKEAGATVEYKELQGNTHAMNIYIPQASKTMNTWFATWIKKKARALKDPGDDKNLAWGSTLGYYDKLKDETRAGLIYLYSPKDKENKVAMWLRWDVFPDEELKELAKEFICVKLDYSNKNYKDFVKELKVKKCALLIVDSKKKVLKKYTKKTTLDKLLKNLKKYKEQMEKAREKKDK